MTQSDQSVIEREVATDWMLDQLEQIRWQLADLMERAEAEELPVASQIEDAARSIYRAEERLGRRAQ